jgi:hypothetical protein
MGRARDPRVRDGTRAGRGRARTLLGRDACDGAQERVSAAGNSVPRVVRGGNPLQKPSTKLARQQEARVTY